MFNEGEHCTLDNELPTRHRRSSIGTLKRYRKERVISETLYGSVWQAEDMRTGRKVVIKSSNRTLARNKTLRNGEVSQEDIDEEIRLHQMLSSDPKPCPYIIPMLDVVYTDVDINLILEHVPGDLFTHVECSYRKLNSDFDIACDENEHREIQEKHWLGVLRLITQVLEATIYLHERRICHRDLSLENTLLSEDGDARVIDFGVARVYEADWLAEKGTIGKIGYQSPECYAGEHYDGRDNDIWAIGVMLWRMLFGVQPWMEPHVDDGCFRLIYKRGLPGIERLLTMWKLSDRLPPYCGDFLAKIFCPQKCRLTVREALTHPYISGMAPGSVYVERRVPIKVAELPDPKLERMAHLTRYNRVEVPTSWRRLDNKQRHQVLEHLAQLNENRCIIDKRVVQEISLQCGLSLDDARVIIHYLWASSEYPSGVKFLDEQSDCKLDIGSSGTVEVMDKQIGERKEELKLEEDIGIREELLDIDTELPVHRHIDEDVLEISSPNMHGSASGLSKDKEDCRYANDQMLFID